MKVRTWYWLYRLYKSFPLNELGVVNYAEVF